MVKIYMDRYAFPVWDTKSQRNCKIGAKLVKTQLRNLELKQQQKKEREEWVAKINKMFQEKRKLDTFHEDSNILTRGSPFNGREVFGNGSSFADQEVIACWSCSESSWLWNWISMSLVRERGIIKKLWRNSWPVGNHVDVANLLRWTAGERMPANIGKLSLHCPLACSVRVLRIFLFPPLVAFFWQKHMLLGKCCFFIFYWMNLLLL